MSKIIIDNRSRLSDISAIRVVEKVIEKGKISQTAGVRHYCHHVEFVQPDFGFVQVECIPNRKSVRFVVHRGLSQ